ncbi:MAG: type II secretion system F family protein [Clostridia bacterium]|jgi:tight adherence protein C|nr:type II secretion system F family protein [Clostridia bacterium]
MIGVIAVFFGIFAFCCIIIVFRTHGEQYDAVQKRLIKINNSTHANFQHDEELSLPFFKRIMKLAIRPLMLKIRRSMTKNPNTKSIFNKFNNEKLKKNIYKSGLLLEAQEYQMIRIFTILGSGAIGYIFAVLLNQNFKNDILFTFVGFYVAYAILRFHLTSKISKRNKAMEQQLPEVLDLLSVNVEAGLGFEQAILHVTENLKGPLVDELTITYREMSMGRTKKDALVIFGERCDIDEVKTFVGSIVQASELGISIRNVLRAQAAAMRQSRRNKIEEKAQKISIKILLPMVMFIFPVIFIILMGPAIVKIFEQFG